MHGVGGATAVHALRQAGFTDVHVVPAQAAPDPAFPTVAFPNPEEPGATDLLGARMRAVAVDDPADIPGLVDGYDVVGVDEVQFFPPQITLVLDGLVEYGMRIIACGLDQDFRGFPFGAMPELLCRAELVDKLQAVCHRCGGPATMTQRLVDGAPATADGDTIVVGALEQYEARCRSCHQLAAPVFAAG
jgi:thymidine kinase